jgi:glycine cleavage system H protein
MSNIPADLRYAKSHEWLRLAADGTATIGITDYAQSSLGDITFVQMPKVGASFAAGATFGVVESVKAASDLYVPVACTVTAVNTALDVNPEKVNQSPYGDAWMLKVKVTDPAAVASLLDPTAYTQHTA